MDVLNLIGLIANAVFFVANLLLATRHRREDRVAAFSAAREARIERVAAAYVRLSTIHPIQDSGIHALIVAGVKDLSTSEEVGDALGRIVARTGAHPLGGDAKKLASASLKDFFTDVTVQGPNTLGYREALAKYSTSPSR